MSLAVSVSKILRNPENRIFLHLLLFKDLKMLTETFVVFIVFLGLPCFSAESLVCHTCYHSYASIERSFHPSCLHKIDIKSQEDLSKACSPWEKFCKVHKRHRVHGTVTRISLSLIFGVYAHPWCAACSCKTPIPGCKTQKWTSPTLNPTKSVTVNTILEKNRKQHIRYSREPQVENWS